MGSARTTAAVAIESPCNVTKATRDNNFVFRKCPKFKHGGNLGNDECQPALLLLQKSLNIAKLHFPLSLSNVMKLKKKVSSFIDEFKNGFSLNLPLFFYSCILLFMVGSE